MQLAIAQKSVLKLLGLGFGAVTPVVVIGLNCIYGMVASAWFKNGTSRHGWNKYQFVRYEEK